MAAFRSRLVSAPIARVLGAWMLVCTGGWAFIIAVAVYAFDRSGAGAVGVVTAARLLPAVFAAPLTGGLVDRADRARVAAGACVVQAACLGVAGGMMLTHASLVVIVVLAAISGAAATAPRPALEALLPALAGSPDELTHATAAWSAADNAGFLLGGGVGGVAITALDPGIVVAIAAALLALAGALAIRLPSVTATEPDEPEEDPEGLASAFAGLRALVHAPLLRVPFALFAGLLVLEGTTDVQVVALSIGTLKMGNGGPGALFALWGIGGLLASAVIVMLVRRRGYGLALTVGSLGFAAGLALAGADGIPMALAGMVPAGVGFALVETGVMGLVPRLADDAIVGRVYALSEVLYAGAGGAGALIAPALIGALGAAGSLAAVGIAFAVGAAIAQGALKRIDSGQEAAGRVRELLRGVSFLAPLPLPRLERLVRGARLVVLPADATIIRAGEPGDEFFVVADGTVEIVEYGRHLGPGTGFGEIALLRDVPRTATVRAVTEVRLWALTRRSFIAAVTDDADATQLADAVVAERLASAGVTDTTAEATRTAPTESA